MTGGKDIPHSVHRGSQEDAVGKGAGEEEERKLHEVPAGRSPEQEEEKKEMVQEVILFGLIHAQKLKLN